MSATQAVVASVFVFIFALAMQVGKGLNIWLLC